jgi:hypothetical protein
MASSVTAAGRLNAVQRHLSVSARAQAGATATDGNDGKTFKKIERMTVFGAGLMGVYSGTE